MNYLVVGSKSWNRKVFDEKISRFPGQWYFIGSQENLTIEKVRQLGPRYIFFLHWSWKVPDEIVDNCECVCFHMTDVPYGRGGSPLQNLIIRGHQHTKLTALRMIHDFDAGPVYLKKDLSLEGNAEEIYIKSSYLSAKMIEHIIQKKPNPVPQTGEGVVFKRRKPEESEIPEVATIKTLYDFIRMLDAEGYPKAFVNQGGFRYEFKSAVLNDNRVTANVTVTPLEVDKK